MPFAGKGAPIVVHPSFKSVRKASGGVRTRGSCVAIVGVNGDKPQFCNEMCVGGVSTQHQLCFDHLHAPVIFKESTQQQDAGRLMRYCQKHGCKRLLPLEHFRGLSPVCIDHPDGRIADGGAPVVGSTVAPEDTLALVQSHAVQLKTLAAGGNGGADVRRVTVCDVVGCQNKPVSKRFVCADHIQVRPPAGFVTVTSAIKPPMKTLVATPCCFPFVPRPAWRRHT